MVNVKVVGDEGVGKSAFVVQYCKGVFEEEIDPTIDDSYRKHVLFDGKNVIAEIHDTVSHNFYKVSLEEWISLFQINRQGNAMMLLFSITNLASFQSISNYKEMINSTRQDLNFPLPIILIGTKSDLETARSVTKTQAENLAKSLNCLYLEISSKNGENVNEAFDLLYREYFNAFPLMIASNGRPRRRKPACHLL